MQEDVAPRLQEVLQQRVRRERMAVSRGGSARCCRRLRSRSAGAAGGAGGLGADSPSAAGGFGADGSFGESADGCFSSGSLAMN